MKNFKIGKFLKEVKTEMKKVNWPTAKETARYTLVVIVATIIVATYLGTLDAVFSYLREMLI